MPRTKQTARRKPAAPKPQAPVLGAKRPAERSEWRVIMAKTVQSSTGGASRDIETYTSWEVASNRYLELYARIAADGWKYLALELCVEGPLALKELVSSDVAIRMHNPTQTICEYAVHAPHLPAAQHASPAASGGGTASKPASWNAI